MKTEATSDDEKRLLLVFRSLPDEDRSTALQTITGLAIDRLLPEFSAYDHMPAAGGVEPEQIEGNIWDQSVVGGTVFEILRDGIEGTGEPHETLFGSTEYDEEYADRFAHVAHETATRQGSFFRYDADFARTYIHAWRWEIVWALARKARETSSTSSPD